MTTPVIRVPKALHPDIKEICDAYKAAEQLPIIRERLRAIGIKISVSILESDEAA